MVAESVEVKQRIVLEDPTEQGIRKALNLGHTVGHAFESLAMRSSLSAPSPSGEAGRGLHPVLHGYAGNPRGASFGQKEKGSPAWTSDQND